MAITLSDFNKIWASTSPLTPYSFSDANYKQGWNFVGATPPARQMWDSYMKFSDEKQKYIVDSFLPLSGGTMTGNLTINSTYPHFFAKYSDIERGVNPSADKSGFAFSSVDKNDKPLWGIYALIDTNGENQMRFYTYKWQSNNNPRTVIFSCASDNSVNFYPSPTNEINLGKSDSYWKHLYCGGATFSSDTVLEEMDYPSTRSAYTVKYTSLANGVAPSSTRQGYLLRVLDSSGSTSTGGLFYYLNSSGTSEMRLYNNWHTQFYVRVFSSNGGQSFLAGADNSVDLGGSNYRWKQVYAGTSTINTSDERVKDNISPIDDAVIDAWGEVGWYQFQFKDAIAKKGENARIHTGTIAQRIKETFEKHNLDAFRYGLLCYDSWDATEEEKDENGKVVQEYRPAGDLYSLRYEEALCMEASYQRRRADRLEARLNALEERIARLEVK